MKKIFMAIVGIAFFSGSFAQKNEDSKFHFSVGGELGFATGTLNNSHSVGIGGTAQAEYNVAPNTNVTLTAGVISYAGKSYISGTKYNATTIIPVRGGIKYFFAGGLYGAAQLGLGFFNNYVDDRGVIYGASTAVAYSPVIGYEFNVNSGKAFDVAFKYDGYATQSNAFGSVGFRVAYKFK